MQRLPLGDWNSPNLFAQAVTINTFRLTQAARTSSIISYSPEDVWLLVIVTSLADLNSERHWQKILRPPQGFHWKLKIVQTSDVLAIVMLVIWLCSFQIPYFICEGIYDPGSRFATTPPPPHGMVPKPAFCSIPHENVVFAVFFAWWVAGAVRNPANSLDFCNQPSENVLFAMFRRRHRGVVPPRPLLFLCQIII